ncbi:MAG TPA: TetR/AcrR family transcriptional regulator [candidate division Zixibacteria bacterium]|nr:TetR/AcrR family transcriptional regulator [candidate division Zixibacteria bacterium]
MRARQAQIVDAARRVIRAKGFHPATVREIGEAAGMTQGTLYNYARSKDDILFLVLDELVRDYHEAVRAAIARETNPRHRLGATVRAFTQVVMQRQDDILLLYQEVHALERSLRARLLARTQEFIEYVQRIVEQAIADGVVTTGNSYFAAQVITFLPAMLALRRWSLRGRLPEAEVAESVVEFIMRGLDHGPVTCGEETGPGAATSSARPRGDE